MSDLDYGGGGRLPLIHKAAFIIGHDAGRTGRDQSQTTAERIAPFLAAITDVDLERIEAFLATLSEADLNDVLIGEEGDMLDVLERGPAATGPFLDGLYASVTGRAA
jgi:hypothetical protein